MASYYMNKNSQATGEHEVHIQSCTWLPDAQNRVYLGEFSNCKDAIAAAKKLKNNVDGCYYCSPACHTR